MNTTPPRVKGKQLKSGRDTPDGTTIVLVRDGHKWRGRLSVPGMAPVEAVREGGAYGAAKALDDKYREALAAEERK